jgi:hypothetical protein
MFSSDTEPQDSVNPVHENMQDPTDENISGSDSDLSSTDDLLEDVRRSLIEEDSQKLVEEKPKWWKRIGGSGSKGKKLEDEQLFVSMDDAMPSVSPEIPVKEVQKDDYVEQIDGLIDMLETDAADSTSVESISEPPVIPQVDEEKPVVVDEEVISVEEQKKRAFHTGPAAPKDENFSEVRAIALEDGEEVFVEIDTKAENPMEDRVKAFENALKPYMQYIYFTTAFLGFVVIVITSLLLFDAYKRSLPPEPTQEADLLPYPVSMNLPGGLAFNLGKGSLKNGRWDPRGPEWLEGTEICRWVAIPYSRQLEAEVRTLTREDQIELLMSNNDRLVYDVYSIDQMTIEDMMEASSNSACLLLVLAESDTDERWVVTALP